MPGWGVKEPSVVERVLGVGVGFDVLLVWLMEEEGYLIAIVLFLFSTGVEVEFCCRVE